MTDAPVPTGVRCPACGSITAPRPEPGDKVLPCESCRAWDRFAAAGTPLVVTREDIAAAEARRRGLPRGRPPLPALLCALAALAAVAEGVLLHALFRPRAVGRIADLRADLHGSALAALAGGSVAVLLGGAGLVLLRSSRLFRAWPWIGAGALGVLAGVVGVVAGAFGADASGTNGWRHAAMPAIVWPAGLLAAGFEDAIVRATAVIVAPGAGGDARRSAIGAGAVIRRDPGRAWIVTCSHVAMPTAAVGSFRNAASAPPVWVYLADGRDGLGRVAWVAEPPLDVAIVAFDVDDPPEPVPVSERAEDLRPGDAVEVVPNPMRDGWMVHRGVVTRREPHATPAGRFSLVYTDLPLRPGDSGSGLFDAQGRLVGINTWGTKEGAPAGISLPSEAMRELLARLATERADETAPAGEDGR